MSNVSALIKKLTLVKKLVKIENKISTDHGHDKYITSQEFNQEK